MWKKGQFQHEKLFRYLKIRRWLEKLLRMEKVARNTRSCQKVAEQHVEIPSYPSSYDVIDLCGIR